MILVPHLETDITQACQLSCVGCNHSVPLWRTHKGGPWSTDPGQMYSDLHYLSKVLHSHAWGALGGEPLLHPRLVEMLHIVRSAEIADTVEIWTNGIRVLQMRSDFWKAFDILVLSIYEGKLSDDTLNEIRHRCQEEGVKLVEKDERTARNFKTMLEPIPTNDNATKEKFAGCFFRHFSRVVNHGYFFTCCCAPHLPMLVQGRSFGDDGIPVKDISEEELSRYLNRTEPLGACTICAGRDTAKPLTWHEIKDPVRWLNASKGLTS